MTEIEKSTIEVAERNDRFRRSIKTYVTTLSAIIQGSDLKEVSWVIPGGKLFFTKGIIFEARRDPIKMLKIFNAITSFNSFKPHNDPHKEHDMGSISKNDLKTIEDVFWTINYEKPDNAQWMDPLNPKCFRVLTIMMASEFHM